MRCLNSPQVLNSLEEKILEGAREDCRHVLVVNAGDGRLARAITEKLGAGSKATVVTLQRDMLHFVDDMAGATSEPWDIDWYAEQVKKHGAFDYIVLYQLHEFWRGELNTFQRLLKLAKPSARIWASFVNAQANRMVARFLPPIRLGFSSLADPMRLGTNLDFASYLDFVGKSGGTIMEIWGMLDQNAQEYCQNQAGQPATWETRGVKVSVGTVADAFLWGAGVVGIAFQTAGEAATSPSPKISFSPYSANLLQALLLPFPDYQTKEGGLAAAEIEIAAWKRPPTQTLGQLARFFLEQLGSSSARRVLLMGAGWGRDLLVLKRQHPSWDWVGFDHNRELVSLGESLAAEAGLSIATGTLDQPLPFADRSFDAVLSMGYFSSLYEPAARHLAKEIRRVSKGPVYHLEDGRGPEQGMNLHSYSLKGIYADLGGDATVSPVLVDGNPIGMYMLKLVVPA